MGSPTVTNTFSNGTTADATAVNQNFTDILAAMTNGASDFSIGALTVAGALAANGSVTLGNATSNDVTVTGYLASGLTPKSNVAYSLGGSSNMFSSIYGTALYAGNISEASSAAGITVNNKLINSYYKPAAGSAVWNASLVTATVRPSNWTSSITNSTVYTITNTTSVLTIQFNLAGYYRLYTALGHTHAAIYTDTRGLIAWGGTATRTTDWSSYHDSGIDAQDSDGFSENTVIIYATANQTVTMRPAFEVTHSGTTGTEHTLSHYYGVNALTFV